ncbi:DUF1501 domain-containing protein [Fimbriimonas ginsengisoli]|uniref:Sulfatase n=1 Tax=Fimbriimonas ginsengisoli Gsoil 348 TaxID=661478 RepID=A0A068NRF6_FIMGI|nr:DUF1501 domain-containing protein [Fimbriimonas ginsengisoli]AIE86098.1 hypothetical protein OP10G_2730 [Fimbriimonas ginsengisoli Gsoil 348]
MSDFLLREITRRTFFKQVGYGIGGVALSSLLAEGLMAAPPQGKIDPFAPRKPHFPAKAKNVIFLFMAGAPSQLDLFDPKPMLNKYDQQPCPEELIKGERFAFIQGRPRLLGSPHKFEQVGKSGHSVSALLPHFKEIADEVAIVHSMTTEQFNHAPAQIFMNTGFQLPGRPAFGSWATYGLGTLNRDLPGFVVLISGENNPDGGKACWGSGFLPSVYQGVEFRSQGEPVLFVNDPDGVPREVRRDTLDAIRDLNGMKLKETLDPEIETRISQYELAYRMQTSVPELMDISKEPAAIHEMYGTEPGKKSFGNNCLLARRLVERGVRFVQLYHRGWDTHGNGESNDIKHALPNMCGQTDKAAAALIKDLKQRGLLDETIVIWGGEFGRTPMNEGRGGSPYPGRDHHPRAFTMWMAGGGIKPGLSLGQTDELGYNVVEDAVSIHDLHATLMHLMGVDHTRLTFQYQGRNFRLTDVSGEVVKKLIV